MTHVNVPRGMRTVMPWRLCSRGLWMVMNGPWPLRRAAGRGISSTPREVAPGQRGRVGGDLVGGAGGHHVPAQLPGPGPEVDHEVRGADRLLVVLDDQHGVAEVAQALERVEQAPVVALVEPDGRLVEDVEHPHQARADLGGQPDALPLAARQRGRRPVQGQVLEADVDEEAQALADLLEHAPGDGRVALGERQLVEDPAGVAHAEAHHVGDGAPGDLEPERLRAEARAPAGRTGALGHELLDLPARVLRRALPVAPLQRGHHALPAAVALAVQDHVAHGLLQLRPGRVEGEGVALGQHLQRPRKYGVSRPCQAARAPAFSDRSALGTRRSGSIS